jgi:hypothetical protein
LAKCCPLGPAAPVSVSANPSAQARKISSRSAGAVVKRNAPWASVRVTKNGSTGVPCSASSGA